MRNTWHAKIRNFRKKFRLCSQAAYRAADALQNGASEHAKYRQVAPDTVQTASGAGAGQSPTVSGATFGVRPAPTPDKVCPPRTVSGATFWTMSGASFWKAFIRPTQEAGTVSGATFWTPGPCPPRTVPGATFWTMSGASFWKAFISKAHTRGRDRVRRHFLDPQDRVRRHFSDRVRRQFWGGVYKAHKRPDGVRRHFWDGAPPGPCPAPLFGTCPAPVGFQATSRGLSAVPASAPISGRRS